MLKPRVILHPTDFSPCSEYAFQIAVDLAKENQATLLVVHVVETLGAENVTYGEAVSQVQPEGYHHRLWEDFCRRIPSVAAAIQVKPLLAQGDPAKEIDRIARAEQCDLVVMGTHGRTGLEHLLMGSVAERVVRYVPCPVLVVKTAPAASSTK
jgi:nucleotide-binding universal stress UspA family protein